MRDDERRAASHQLRQPLLDRRLALAVERRSCLVQDQDPRVGQDRPCRSRRAGAPSGELHPPLGRRPYRKPREASARSRRNARSTRPEHLLARGVRTGVGDVLETFRRKRKLSAARSRAASDKSESLTVEDVAPVHQVSPRSAVETGDDPDQRALAGAGGAHERRDGVRPRCKRDPVKGPACRRLYSKWTSRNSTHPSSPAADARARDPRPSSVTSSRISDAFRPAKHRDLAADLNDLTAGPTRSPDKL